MAGELTPLPGPYKYFKEDLIYADAGDLDDDGKHEIMVASVKRCYTDYRLTREIIVVEGHQITIPTEGIPLYDDIVAIVDCELARANP